MTTLTEFAVFAGVVSFFAALIWLSLGVQDREGEMPPHKPLN